MTYYGLRNYKGEPLVWGGRGDCRHEWVSAEKLDKRGVDGSRLEGTFQAKALRVPIKTDTCTICGAVRGQLGHEPDPDMYISHLCDIFDQVRRVLKPTGTLWVNVADSYAGSGKGIGSDHGKAVTCDDDIPAGKCPSVPAKSLIGIPERFVLEMGRRGWIRRSTIIWHKPACMPASVKDRFTVDFEYLYFFSQKQDFFFEQQFEPLATSSIKRVSSPFHPNPDHPTVKCDGDMTRFVNTNTGRNKRCVWSITAEGFKGAHFAVFPSKLCETPILAGCPEFICTRCGKPRVKLYETKPMVINRSGRAELSGNRTMPAGTMISPPESIEIGLSDCGCGASFMPGVVLDPFAGTGTVAVAARKLGRKSILIENSIDYIKMAVERIQRISLPLRKDS